MNYIDGELKNNITDCTEKCMKIMLELLPSEVYIPYEKDANSDHVSASIAIKKAIFELEKKPLIYKYSIALSAAILPEVNAKPEAAPERITQYVSPCHPPTITPAAKSPGIGSPKVFKAIMYSLTFIPPIVSRKSELAFMAKNGGF